MRALVIIACLVGLTGTAAASKPIPWTMKGCVTGGVFYSIDKDSAGQVKTLGKKPLDISKLDGKRIEVAGSLHPGDYFTPGDAPPKVTGDCTADDRRAIEYAKAHELRLDGLRLAREGKKAEALKAIDAAIKLVTPADCDTYLDRAQLLTPDDFAATVRDIEIVKARKCRYRGSLNFITLHELGNALRARMSFKTAVEVLQLALAACGGSDLCRPDIEKDLAAAKANK
jgi:hypothetical protein